MSTYSPIDMRTVSRAEYARAKEGVLSGRPIVPLPVGDVRGLSDIEYAAAKSAALAAAHRSASPPPNMPAAPALEPPLTGIDTGTTAALSHAPAPPVSYGVAGRTALHMSDSEYAAARSALLNANP